MSFFATECAFYCLLFLTYCSGAVKSQTQPVNGMEMDKDAKPINPSNNTLKELYSLLNRTIIQNLITNHSNITKGPLATDQLNQLLELAKPLGYPNQSSSATLENRFKETSNGEGWQSSVTEVKLSDRQPESSKPDGSAQGLENNFSGTEFINKSPLEYRPQKPTFAGVFSAGQPAQLIPPGKPWPAEEVTSQALLEDRFKETTPTPTASSTNKSPLEYRPQKPTFAGDFSAGQPAQLIPPGKPWPAEPPATKQPSVEDRFPDVDAFVTDSTRPPGSNPFFAGSFSNGYPSQLIPPGKPWPADP